MSDPERLLSEGSDFEKELLGSWQHDKPSPSARARALAIAGAVGAATTVASTSAAAAGSIAPKAATVASFALTKWIAIGAVTLAATAGAVAFVGTTTRAPAPVVLAPKATPALASAIAAFPSEPTPAPPPSVPARDSELAAAHAAPLAHATPKAPHAAPSALSAEIAALDRARQALENGDSSDAQKLVGDYQKRFKGGALSEEAEVLRIQALAARGDTAAAKAAAARFLAAHPSSPHAAVVRAATSDAGK